MMMRADGVTDIRFTLTRERPEGWDGYTGRINADLLSDIVWPPSERPSACVRLWPNRDRGDRGEHPCRARP